MLPYLTGARKRERDILTFGGLNYGEGAVDGELKESEGLSSRDYPALSVRRPRRAERTYTRQPDAVFSWNKLVEVVGGLLRYDGRDMCSVSEGPKQFAVVANKLVVYPDKKVLDLDALTVKNYGDSVEADNGGVTTVAANAITLATSKTLGHGTSSCFYQPSTFMESVLSFESAKVWLETGEIPYLWDSGQHLGIAATWDSANAWVGDKLAARKTELGEYLPIKGDINWDKEQETWNTKTQDWRGEPNTDGVYLYITKSWTASNAPTSAVCFEYDVRSDIETPPVFDGHFAPGDRVKVELEGKEYHLTVKTASGLGITFTTSELPEMVTHNAIRVSHDYPDLDYICAKDNRLWGFCNKTQTIYASALGLPMEFNDFDYANHGDLASYAVAVGSAGDVTAITAYSGAVLLWKENKLYKVLGNNPSEYAYYEYDVSGVQQGCHASQTVINEVLYFLGREGVYAYTGSVPQLVSTNLGTRRFSGGVAGTDGRRYYISMRDDDSGEWGLYCYDTLRGLWLREDDTEAAGFARLGKRLYMQSRSDNILYEIDGGGDERVKWSAEFAAFDETTLHRKRYTRIALRLELGEGTEAKVEIKEDNGLWRALRDVNGTSRGTASVPISPIRCDRLHVRISGEGFMTLRGVEREYVTKSER